ncbi:hypothetical protein AB4Z51_31090 [Bradyrhizobium sp. 2TAF36]|uniref:hypothetical protein n=1 Tax=Bradyrhizobium sp. 2TAF36 TaxID=3233016 RepID=UPI003F8E3A61
MCILTSHADRAAPHHHLNARWGSHCLMVALLCAASLFQFAPMAWGQCSARDVLQNQLKLGKVRAVDLPQKLIGSARDVPTWKTIAVGTFGNSFAYVELLVVSAVQLGFKTDSVPLAVIYARARQLGLELAAAEVGPQLRLQYLDQPMGEFLIVGMQPIKTWSGEPVVLNVANGGAGLILIGQDGRDDAEIPATSRFLFVRPPDLSGGIAAALLPP